MKKVLLVPLLVMLISALSGQEEKGYLLASKSPALPVGEVFKVKEEGAMNEAAFEIKLEGIALKGAISVSTMEEIQYEFLANDRIRATVLKDRTVGKRTMAGNEEDLDEVEVTEGRVFLMTRKEGDWTVEPEVKEVEAADQEAVDEMMKDLKNEFTKTVETNLKLYGDQPRKVGDSWEVDAVEMPGMDNVDIVGGKMEVIFLKVEDVRGEPCAVLRVKFKMSGVMKEEGVKGLGVEMEGAVKVWRSLKYLMDFKVKGNIGMEAAGAIAPQAGMMADMKMSGEMKVGGSAVKVIQEEKE